MKGFSAAWIFEMEISIEKRNVSQEENDLIGIFLSNPDLMALKIRHIDLHDSQSKIRKEWINKSINKYLEFDFNIRPDILMSTSPDDYDVVIFSGEDTNRICRFMRDHAQMMVTKIKICICIKSTPRRRSELLLSGFDDAIDIKKTHPTEFIARLFSISSRYRQNKEITDKAFHIESKLCKVSYADKLPPKQKSVLTHLLNSPRFSANYESLRMSASSDHDLITSENLKVIISGIRKLLKPGFRIVSDRSAIYRIEPHFKDD